MDMHLSRHYAVGVPIEYPDQYTLEKNEVGVDILSDCNCRGFSRSNCPKTTALPVLLSQQEQKIWDESEPIHDQNTELVQAILAKYGFTEV